MTSIDDDASVCGNAAAAASNGEGIESALEPAVRSADEESFVRWNAGFVAFSCDEEFFAIDATVALVALVVCGRGTRIVAAAVVALAVCGRGTWIGVAPAVVALVVCGRGTWTGAAAAMVALDAWGRGARIGAVAAAVALGVCGRCPSASGFRGEFGAAVSSAAAAPRCGRTGIW